MNPSKFNLYEIARKQVVGAGKNISPVENLLINELTAFGRKLLLLIEDTSKPAAEPAESNPGVCPDCGDPLICLRCDKDCGLIALVNKAFEGKGKSNVGPDDL